MIVVKVELWPGGSEEHSREIGRTYIANVGGTSNRGNYRVAVCKRGDTRRPCDLYTEAVEAGAFPLDLNGTSKYPKATRTARVENYPRLSYSVWRLVLRALKSCFPEEK